MRRQEKNKIKVKIIIICMMLLLNGCALLGTVIQLAPLAAIFVYYSAPSELNNNEFACLKTIDYYKQSSKGHEAVKTKSEYYICLVNIDKGSVKEIVELPNKGSYDIDKAVVYFKEDKICLVLDEVEGTWQVELTGDSFKKISDDKIIPAKYNKSNTNYAMLPTPEIKEITLP
jgi:hypothetical protein